jgi:hypothetical protein
MGQNTYRSVITITTLITALIHLVVLNILLGGIDPLFTLNGLGYLVLLAVYLFPPGFLQGRSSLVYIAFIGFTAVTILAWVFLGDLSDPLGIFTKIVEVILLVALVLDWRRQS